MRFGSRGSINKKKIPPISTLKQTLYGLLLAHNSCDFTKSPLFIMANNGHAVIDMADPEKAVTNELEEDGTGSGSRGSGSNNDSRGVDGGVNYHSWDNHTSFNKYPTHEEGFRNKVCLL